MDWPSAQEQITGWQKPKHRCFATRIEAQRFLDEDQNQVIDTSMAFDSDGRSLVANYSADSPVGPTNVPPTQKKTKKSVNNTRLATSEYNEADFEPGTAPLPPEAEDGFDPNIRLDPVTGKIVYKTLEQRQATKPRPLGGAQTEPIRVHTDGSSLGNGKLGAFAGIGVYFGPGDKRYITRGIFHMIARTNPFTQWQERVGIFARFPSNQSTG